MPVNTTDQDSKKDPFNTSFFSIEVDGVAMATFSSASGLETKVDVIEDLVATKDGKTLNRKIPGKIHYGDITFTRGMTKDMALYDWHQKILDGKLNEAVKTASVVIYDVEGTEVARWNLERAWPSALKISDLKAAGGEVAVEQMTFVSSRIERVKK